MFGITRTSRHWLGVAMLFLIDGLIVWLSFFLGIVYRFGEPAWDKFGSYLTGILSASLVLPCLYYVGGLYSSGRSHNVVALIRWFFIGIAGVGVIVLAMGSLDFSARIGRGVLVASMGFLLVISALHHWILFRRWSRLWRTALCLVSSDADEGMAVLLNRLWGHRARLLGMVTGGGYQTASDLPVMGEIGTILAKELNDIDLILVRDRHLADPQCGPLLRQLRYRGVEIVSLADACEDAYRAVPIDLVTENWLFRACSQSDLFYIKKLKRAFDVVASLLGMIFLFPIMLLGAIFVRFASPGPAFFRQERAGRLGRPFTILKLRTMHLDAEKGGPQWARSGDERIFPGGHFLRRFRVDEIPQLINVLRGEMSFVGPRPERVEFIGELSEQIPWYQERLLIQPGLTGWAQVRYPYGASIEDAVRKLEYELYYMKHMSLLLDFFILVETVKIVLFGGVRKVEENDYAQFRAELREGELDQFGKPTSPQLR